MARYLRIAITTTILLYFTLLYTTGCSHTSTSGVSTIADQPPAAPYNLAAESVSQTTVTLRWTDGSNDEDGFKVYRDGVIIGSVGANTNTIQDSGLRLSTTYRYSVTAYNQAGESNDASLSVTTKNPPATVRLKGIGVYDNGEDLARDIDGGEVYVYAVISDGTTTVEQRIPYDESSYLFLDDDEVVNISQVLYSTEEVSDELTVAFIGYESDGGSFEQFVYMALGSVVQAQVPAGGILEAFNLNLGGLIGRFTGEGDDYLGSYENTWGKLTSWGTGEYNDVVCYKEDGTPALRLWFTIESSLELQESGETEASTFALAQDSMLLDKLDDVAFRNNYPELPEQYPFNDCGVYLSNLFALNEGDTACLFIQSNSPICIENTTDNCEEALALILFLRISKDVIRSGAVYVTSCEVDDFGSAWEATIMFMAGETGLYQVGFENKSDKSTSCEYVIFTE